jgi:hypothetical protein
MALILTKFGIGLLEKIDTGLICKGIPQRPPLHCRRDVGLRHETAIRAGTTIFMKSSGWKPRRSRRGGKPALPKMATVAGQLRYHTPLAKKNPPWGCRGAGAPPPEGGVKAPPSEPSSALRAPGRSSGAPATGEFTFDLLCGLTGVSKTLTTRRSPTPTRPPGRRRGAAAAGRGCGGGCDCEERRSECERQCPPQAR